MIQEHLPLIAGCLLGCWMLFVCVELVLLRRQLNKVDDLANALHVDLLKAEERINELTPKKSAKRLPPVPQRTAPATQVLGRHARAE